MECEEVVSANDIKNALRSTGFDLVVTEGRLLLLELLVKAGSGCYNSHTEELFLNKFPLMSKGRVPNKKGRKFICSMVYKHSNNRPKAFFAMSAYRS